MMAMASEAPVSPKRTSAADRRCIVIERLVDTATGKTLRKSGGFERYTAAEALAAIKIEQRKYEKSGHDKMRDRHWGWSPTHPGCAPQEIHVWTIERVRD